jgi:hypothetical protein
VYTNLNLVAMTQLLGQLVIFKEEHGCSDFLLCDVYHTALN